jgi:hypothetical protein
MAEATSTNILRPRFIFREKGLLTAVEKGVSIATLTWRLGAPERRGVALLLATLRGDARAAVGETITGRLTTPHARAARPAFD